MIVERVDGKATLKALLSQYRKRGGRWQFFAIARNQKGEPEPVRISIAGKQMDWRSLGAEFYFGWLDSEIGNRIREIAGRGTSEANEAWIRKSHVHAGEIDDEPVQA